MKKIFTICMLAMSIIAANAAELVCEGFVSRPNNNKCAYGHAFSWSAANANTMEIFSFEAGTLSDYATMKITLSNFVDLTEDKSVGNANKVRIIFLAGSSTVKTQQFATINGQEKTLNLAELMSADQLATVDMIVFGGTCAAGSVDVEASSIKLVKADETELICAGFVKRPNNNKCAYENTFSWSAANANTMEIFSFEAGTLSNYDSMYITMSHFIDRTEDQSVGNAEKVRVLFIAGSTTVKTQKFATIDGKQKKLVLSELMSADDIASIDLIAIGGLCAAGSVAVNAEDIKLVNEQTTAISTVNSESKKAIKVIRDGQLFIIRDGKTYNVLGF